MTGMALAGWLTVLLLLLVVASLWLSLSSADRVTDLVQEELEGQRDEALAHAAALEAQLAEVAAQHGPVSETDPRCVCGAGVDCPTGAVLSSDPCDPDLPGRILDTLREADR